MVDSVFDDSDNYSPVPVAVSAYIPKDRSPSCLLDLQLIRTHLQKPKAKAAPKAALKKAAAGPKVAPKKAAQTTSKPKTAKVAASKKRPKPDSDGEDSDSSNPPLRDESLLSATPPSAKKQKKAPAPKKAGGKPLQELENEAVNLDGTGDPKPKKGTGSSDQYQKVGTALLPHPWHVY